MQLSTNEKTELFKDNVIELNSMSTISGSAVKGLIINLEKNNTFIRLYDPKDHEISYKVLEGDADRVVRIGERSGLEMYTDLIKVKTS